MSEHRNHLTRRSLLEILGFGVASSVSANANTGSIPEHSLSSAIETAPCSSVYSALPAPQVDDLVFEVALFTLRIGRNGLVKSFRTADGRERLAKAVPFMSALQSRPYQNELQLTSVAQPTRFICNSIRKLGGNLRVRFDQIDHEVTVSVSDVHSMLVFRVTEVGQVPKEFKGRFYPETPLDALNFVQLSLTPPLRYGRWLNAAWFEGWGVGLLGLGSSCLIQGEQSHHELELSAQASESTGLLGTGAVVVAAPNDQFLGCVEKLERYANLPRGVEARRLAHNGESYLLVETLTDLEAQLQSAMRIGLTSVLISYRAVMKTAGHFLYRPEVGSLSGLAALFRDVRDRGFLVGFHVHYTKAMFDDPYITPVPDARLYQAPIWRLTKPARADDSVLFLRGLTGRPYARSAQKTLRIGDEFIQFEALEADSGHVSWLAVGCTRGAYGTQPSDHPRHAQVGLCSDVVGVVGIYDQDSEIPAEVAGRIAEMNDACDFDFIYFDGAEDVPPPYWYNVSAAQMTVWSSLKRPVVCGEGACRAHASWHLLSRGHAFDSFENDEQKRAVREIIVPEAQRMRDDLTPVNFGWLRLMPPSRLTVGSQPDAVEYTAARAAAYGSPLSLILTEVTKGSIPRFSDCIDVLRTWRQLVSLGKLTERKAFEIQSSDAEFMAIPHPDGPFVLEGEELIREDRRKIRVVAFQWNSKPWAVIWAPINGNNLLLPNPGCEVWTLPGGSVVSRGVTEVAFAARTWLSFEGYDYEEVKSTLLAAPVGV